MTKIDAQTVLKNTKNFKKILAIAFFILTGIIWTAFWLHDRYYVSTDDAYLNANIVQIAPRITGQIAQLYVSNNQYVEKGQVLFAIDAQPFNIAVAQASAQLAMNTANWHNAQSTAVRTLSLVKRKFSSPQQGDNAMSSLENTAAAVDLAKANLAQAQLNLQYTNVTAPTSGWVANLSARVGNIATANQPLFAIISNEVFWVDANYKETELANIRPGMKAIITTDLYPHHPFEGVVESISNGTGTVFSLLPPQNATGNWVKVTQRVPVRVRLLNTNPRYPLRIGTSSNVKVNIHDGTV